MGSKTIKILKQVQDDIKMKLIFITTNSHKFIEAKEILAEFDIEAEQKNFDYEENHDEDCEEIVRSAAKKLAKTIDAPFVIEDTGIFFEAYNNFPGALPKFVFNAIGYKGIFKLLEGESRKAYLKSIVGYCEPNCEPIIFEGIRKGSITDKVYNEDKDRMPYERIFIPDGMNVTVSDLSLEQKNAISHRAEAFRKLGEYLTND